MATGQPLPCSEDQSHQHSPVQTSPEVIVEDEIPKFSEPRLELSPSPRSNNLKRFRDWSSSGSEDDDLAELRISGEKTVWAMEKLSGLKMTLKRRRVPLVLPEHHKAFTRLLENPTVKRFLAWDKDLLVSDKYLLAMVIAYFSRAGMFAWQYRPIHFFLALYLASDMEEDIQTPKQEIFTFLYGKPNAPHSAFHKLRFQFFRSMGCNAWVSPEECQEIQAYDPDLWVWKRDRGTLFQNPSTQEPCANWREKDYCPCWRPMIQRKSKITLVNVGEGERCSWLRRPRKTLSLLKGNRSFHIAVVVARHSSGRHKGP